MAGARGFARRGSAARRTKKVNNIQLYIAVGLPTFAILVSLVISLVQISGIREDSRELRRELNAKVDQINTKIDLLTGKVYELMAK